MYSPNNTGVKKTMLISPEQDSRLKAYCKYNRVSASQLFRLLIDELSVSQFDRSLKDNIQVNAMRVNNFINPASKEMIKEVVNDGNGHIRTRWWRDNEQMTMFNSYPHQSNNY